MITTSTEGGIIRPVTIDGIDLAIFPDSLSVQPEPISESVDTIDGGSVTFYPTIAGGPTLIDRYTISFPLSVVDGTARRDLERIRARGGFHTLSIWKPLPAFYDGANPFATGASNRTYLLPRYRQNAGQVFAGLSYGGVTISTTNAALRCWINDVEKTVTYVATPADLGSPAAGAVVVSAAPYTSGAALDYVPFRIGGVTNSDTIEIEFFPVFIVLMTSTGITFPRASTESHNYTFLER